MNDTKYLKHYDSFICSSVTVPQTFFQRAKGLLGKKYISQDEAIFFSDCSSIHMFGMQISLDIVFLDREFRIVKMVENLKPWRLAWCNKAQHTLEMASGSVSKHGFSMDDKLRIKEYTR